MKNYELLYIVSNQFTDDEAGKIKAKVNGLIEKNGGVIGYQEDMGKKKLAYPIKKVSYGYYFVAEFELEDGKKLAEINQALRLDKEVVRAQIIVKDKITDKEIARKKAHAEKAETFTEEVKAEEPAKKSDDKKKIKMKDLDEKLDEILQDNNIL